MDITFLIHHFNHHRIDSIWTFDSKRTGFYFKHAPYPWLIFDLNNQTPTIYYSLHTTSTLPLLQYKHPLDALMHQQTLTSIDITDEGILFHFINDLEIIKTLCFSSMPYHPTLTLRDQHSILYPLLSHHKDVKYPVVLTLLETNVFDDLSNISFLSLLSIFKKHLDKKEKRMNFLLQDKEKHRSLLFYKDVAEDLLIRQMIDTEYLKKTYNLTLPFHQFNSLGAFVTYLFHQYKRAKQGIFIVEKQVEEAKSDLQSLKDFLTSITPFSLTNHQRLRTKLEALHLLNSKEKKVSLIKAENPYIFSHKGTTYSFGKNKKQNHHLTFHLAQKKFIFVHIKDFPGSHIIIHRQDMDHESLVFAGQLSLFLSKQSSGIITYTKVGSLKATHTEGMVIVKNAKEMKVNLDHTLSFETIIKNATRY